MKNTTTLKRPTLEIVNRFDELYEVGFIGCVF